MSDRLILTNMAEDITTPPPFAPVSRVVVRVESGDSYVAGTDAGQTISIDCPYGNQKVADDLLELLRGFVYVPISATNAILDPAAEIGDCVSVDGVEAMLAYTDINFDPRSLMSVNFSAPGEHEIENEYPRLTREQQKQLYQAVLEDYADVPFKADRIKKLKIDKYYNALQIKYAYAVTCHKAQGGQWAHVYLDQGYMTDDMLSPDYIHWLYTAFTRATEKLFLVNWPKTQIKQ